MIRAQFEEQFCRLTSSIGAPVVPEEEQYLEIETGQPEVSVEYVEQAIAKAVSKYKKEQAFEIAAITSSLQCQIGK